MSYLYHFAGDFDKMEQYSSRLSDKSSLYNLDPTELFRLARVFLAAQDLAGFNNCMEVNHEKNPRLRDDYVQTQGGLWLKRSYDGMVKYHETNPQTTWWYTFNVPYAYWKTGMPEKAISMSDQIILETPDQYLMQKLLARAIHSFFRQDLEQSLKFLEEAVDEGFLLDLSLSPIFEDLHEEPRFQEVLSKQAEKRAEISKMIEGMDLPSLEELDFD